MNAGSASSRLGHEHGSDSRRNAERLLLPQVPPDSIQTRVSNLIGTKLKYKRVYIIDDQEAYSAGSRRCGAVEAAAAGVTVTRDGVSQQQSDFSSLIAKIPRDTQMVYVPRQLPPKGEASASRCGQQVRAAST